MISKNLHINEAINLYNTQFDKLEKNFDNVRIIEPFTSQQKLTDIYQSDDYHFSKYGQQLVFENIRKVVLQDFPNLL